MANKFSCFEEEKKAKEKIEEIKSSNPKAVENIEEKVNEYSKLNSNDLLNEFLIEAKKGKQEGTINSEYLKNIKNNLMPYLNNEQKSNLNNLLDMIDD